RLRSVEPFVEYPQQRGAVLCNAGEPVGEPVPSDRERVREIAEVRGVLLADPRGQPGGLLRQLLPRVRREDDQPRGPGRTGASPGGGGRLLDDEVGVGTARAEGAYGAPAWPSVGRGLPSVAARAQVEGAGVQVDGAVGLLEVRRARDLLVPHREEDLEDPRDA